MLPAVHEPFPGGLSKVLPDTSSTEIHVNVFHVNVVNLVNYYRIFSEKRVVDVGCGGC